MRVDEAISGGAGTDLSTIVTTITTQLNAFRGNIQRRLTEAGIDTSGVQNDGDLAKLIKENGYTSIARLLGAIHLALALIVREMGRYLGSDKFSEVLKEELAGFTVPSLNEVDSLLATIEGGGQTTPSTLEEELEEVTEKMVNEEEEKESESTETEEE